jgi:hypothetical protein
MYIHIYVHTLSPLLMYMDIYKCIYIHYIWRICTHFYMYIYLYLYTYIIIFVGVYENLGTPGSATGVSKSSLASLSFSLPFHIDINKIVSAVQSSLKTGQVNIASGVFTYMNICIFVYVNTNMYFCICIYIYIYIHIYIYICICKYAYIYICTYICIFIYIYIYIHIYTYLEFGQAGQTLGGNVYIYIYIYIYIKGHRCYWTYSYI